MSMPPRIPPNRPRSDASKDMTRSPYEELLALRVQKDTKQEVSERLAGEQDSLFRKIDEIIVGIGLAADASRREVRTPTQNVRDALVKLEGLVQSWQAAVQEAQVKDARDEKDLTNYKNTTASLVAYERDDNKVLGKKNGELEGRLAAAAGTIRELEKNQAALKSQLAIKDQVCKDAQARLQSSISSLDTLTHHLNDRHTLEMDALRNNHAVRAAELSEQVNQLQGEFEEERWARKQQGEGAELAHKALHDRQALLEQAYQRITAAEAASHQGESKAQALQADLTQEAVDLKGHMDAELAHLRLQLAAASKETARLANSWMMKCRRTAKSSSSWMTRPRRTAKSCSNSALRWRRMAKSSGS
ncbi:TPA: hypothetical protein ACH3X3_005866 [Trebouxia sp. C0006]